MFVKLGKKQGGITMEVVFSILLGLGVLFLVLGLFSDNLKGMITQSNMSNMFNNNGQKTAFELQKTDPTGNQINVAETQIAGEHGLSWYNETAKSKIEELSKISPLTDAQKIDLAKWLTIYGNSGTTNSTAESLSMGRTSDGKSYSQLAYENGIYIKWSSYTTIVGDNSYNWRNENTHTGISESSTIESEKISNIKAIEGSF